MCKVHWLTNKTNAGRCINFPDLVRAQCNHEVKWYSPEEGFGMCKVHWLTNKTSAGRCINFHGERYTIDFQLNTAASWCLTTVDHVQILWERSEFREESLVGRKSLFPARLASRDLLRLVNGAGELLILHAPKSLQFEGNEPLDESLLREVYSGALGFSVSKGSKWGGLKVLDPFHYPEAVVGIVVDGLPSLGISKGSHFPLITNQNEEATWHALNQRVSMRFPDQSSVLTRLDTVEGNNAGLSTSSSPPPLVQYLNPNETEDAQFIQELLLVKQLTHKVKSESGDGVPDVYWLVLRALHPVIDLHGTDSDAAIEAKNLLIEAIKDLDRAFVHAYKGQVLVSVVTSDVSHTRKSRSLMAEVDADSVVDNMNVSKEYDPNYPVIFNILLWFNIAFFYSIIAVAVFIAKMDPGRDSIIYRMTSTRMKKDN
uniref:Renin receptor n=1 Tax=Timema monikensis TaxID=170555 RepID=A0A7R9HQE7_9NEOP|nr:unnamed protein product [Timema monikensis]